MEQFFARVWRGYIINKLFIMLAVGTDVKGPAVCDVGGGVGEKGCSRKLWERGESIFYPSPTLINDVTETILTSRNKQQK